MNRALQSLAPYFWVVRLCIVVLIGGSYTSLNTSFRNSNTNLRSTEDSNRTALGGQYRVGTENELRIPVNRSEKIRASYVAIASVGENPRPQLDVTSP